MTYRPLLSFVTLLACVTLASAQVVVPPVGQNAEIGAYNASPQSCTPGSFCQIQTDINGNLKTSPATPAVDSAPLGGPGSCSSTCANTTLLGPIDTTGYGGISVQILSVGGGATLTFQGSNDPICSTATNWVVQPGAQEAAFGPGNGAISGGLTTSSSATSQSFSTTFRCFRVQITAYTSGTITAQGYLRIAPAHIYIQGAVSVLTQSLPPYPGAIANTTTSTPITATATGTTAALAITLPGVAAKTTYLCGYTISADATAATEGAGTITGTISGTMNFRQSVANVTNGTATTQQVFTPCVPASAVNTAITINSVAPGAGGNTAGYAWGFQL